jgi:DNA-directed RNA polymerase sigma subunit (sigma70/sigma32)
MLFWIIKITLISVIFIFLVHYLINFFKSVLTVPKIKDLVNSPTKKYENMYKILKDTSNTETTSNNDDYTLIDLLPSSEEEEVKPTMKNELKNFLKKQLNETSLSEGSYNNY